MTPLDETMVRVREQLDKISREPYAEEPSAIVVTSDAIELADIRALLAALDESRKDGDKLRDILDCGTNALRDSILASGNDSRTNLHWVRKMRRDSGLVENP